jgi:hypothetical protein
MSDLTICGTCFVVYGGTGVKRQLCECASEAEHQALSEASYERDGTHWHRVGEVCRCCGAEVLDASIKYAKWFCPECFGRVDQVNRALGSCALPIGWHSIINGVYAPGNRLKTLPAITAFADQLSTFFRESGGVWAWGRGIVERHWHRVGLPLGEDLAVDEYLEAVWAHGVDKEALFEELVAAKGIPANWRQFEAVPLELVWVRSDDGALHQAMEETVWAYPDGEDEYAVLFLRVFHEADDRWIWGLVIDEEAAGENDTLLMGGASASLAQAKADCEAAATDLIAREDARSEAREQAEKERWRREWDEFPSTDVCNPVVEWEYVHFDWVDPHTPDRQGGADG